jgi:hypothetical protein
LRIGVDRDGHERGNIEGREERSWGELVLYNNNDRWIKAMVN